MNTIFVSYSETAFYQYEIPKTHTKQKKNNIFQKKMLKNLVGNKKLTTFASLFKNEAP